ncbi:MAG: tRNA guanosine(34) transglycosylase Tgt [Candidatus Berkelbacteria bacterium]|nr:tRNA guanosine(34) transglycosylase Tgt [Candidatus Berkelbacteria bacterium]
MFKILKKSKKTFARTGIISTSHGDIQTPVFMPCGTVGAVKGISAEELKEIGFEIILGNTYHLYLRPGEKLIKKHGGLQKFTNWNKPILTDSGGYQLFSLGNNFVDYKSKDKKALAKATNRGVQFKSVIDGSSHLFTPEKVIDIQKDLGSDIMMVLDECTEYPATRERAEKSMQMTHVWAKRAVEYWRKGDSPHGDCPQLFGIVQGSTFKDLRLESAKFISSLPFDGVAVGGVSVGEGKKHMYDVMKWLGPILPKDKPRYLMGVGEPEDIIEAVKWGFDMFDCVLPTRLGRHGTVWITSEFKKFTKIDLRKSQYRDDKNIIMKGCGCPACQNGYSRAYISHLIREKEMLGMRLASLHNLWIIQELINKIRKDI